jgi:hypothetical protein
MISALGAVFCLRARSAAAPKVKMFAKLPRQPCCNMVRVLTILHCALDQFAGEDQPR